MAADDRPEKPRFSRTLKWLIVALGLICGIALIKQSGDRAQLEREQDEQRQRFEIEQRATVTEYVASGRLIGMTDQEMIAIFGPNEPYERRDGTVYRSWNIFTYHKPEMRNELIDFGWRLDLKVESRDRKVIRCELQDFPNG